MGMLTAYPSMASRSSPLYMIPSITLTPSLDAQQITNNTLGGFIQEMNIWKQLYTMETSAGAGASLLTAEGLLEVTSAGVDDPMKDVDIGSVVEQTKLPLPPENVSSKKKEKEKEKEPKRTKSAKSTSSKERDREKSDASYEYIFVFICCAHLRHSYDWNDCQYAITVTK